MIGALIQEIQDDNSAERDRAEQALNEIIKRTPYYDHAYIELANIYAQRNDVESEIAVRYKLEEFVPGVASNRFALASIFSRMSDWSKSKYWHDKGLNSPIICELDRMLPYGVVTKARILHDSAQLEYLISHNLLPDDYTEINDAYKICLHEFPKNEIVWQLPQSLLLAISPFYRRCLIYKGGLMPNTALNPALGWESVLARVTQKNVSQRFAVLDDFLSPECLESLWRFSLESTIWHNDSQKGKDYIGAYYHNGFSGPLIEKISSEIATHLKPAISSPLSQVWAYRSVLGNQGIGIHADDSNLNINIWLTPESANQNQETGGLVLYDKAAPNSWVFDDYNNNSDKIDNYLLDSQKSIIPYKRNRATIFDSSLFHASHSPEFGSQLDEMRLNVTFLYGRR